MEKRKDYSSNLRFGNKIMIKHNKIIDCVQNFKLSSSYFVTNKYIGLYWPEDLTDLVLNIIGSQPWYTELALVNSRFSFVKLGNFSTSLAAYMFTTV